MSLAACAGLVARADPDRFLAAMAAPVAARETLFPIYALNVEVSRAPWVTQEAMIAEMRLQWWRDALEELAQGKRPRAHEVVGPLAQALGEGTDWGALDRFVAARRWDIYRDPFEDDAHFERYLQDTAGTLMWVSAQALGAAEASEAAVRGFGWAVGLANYLRAVPALEERGRIPLLDGRPTALVALAETGLARLSDARDAAGPIPARARAALRAGWLAGPILKQVRAEPGRVAEGALGVSEFARRARLMALSATGRW
ncbi:squalene/phytoene synthase family protein [Tropicimonas sp. S265A]|uniref:squalene/phytoene synthase family protein n=1 Tax=Tropicimonas sp. S265A TaxID=3415134 RepID=UPI003C7AED54